MTTATVTETVRNGNVVGDRIELARYTTPTAGARLIVGQRVHGVVRLVDVPARGRGRAYLIERELEQDGYSALQALVDDYLRVARELGEIPMASHAVRDLEHVR